MIASRIETPREFFDHVVEVDVSEFLTNPLDLRGRVSCVQFSAEPPRLGPYDAQD
jgi:hypothetical protein